MSTNTKRTLEKVSGISAFVIGIFFSFIFLLALFSFDMMIIVNSLLFILFNGFLIYFGACVGISKNIKPRFGQVFNIISLSFLGAMLYSNGVILLMFVYLLPCITGFISLFQKYEIVNDDKVINTYSSVNRTNIDNINSVGENRIIDNKTNNFNIKIMKLKELRDKDLISDEQYKEEVNKILKNI